MPGLGALTKGGSAEVNSVSCASAGNCAADGGDSGGQGFVAVKRNGVWGKAIEVPGLGALNKDGATGISSVSRGSAGNCAAGGGYSQPANIGFPFIATERGGHWGKAVSLPADGDVYSISCASAGTCLADGSAAGQNVYCAPGNAFFVEERAGRWGHLRRVPGLRALKHGGSSIDSVAYPSAGNCAVGGAYHDRSRRQAFVAVERNGRWGQAIQVPGLGALNAGGNADADSVSCGSAGNCAAGGYYTGRSHHRQGFVAVERNGVWGTAIPVPGLRALNAGGSAEVDSLSCPSPGHCAAGGYYTDYTGRHGHSQGFVVSQTG